MYVPEDPLAGATGGADIGGVDIGGVDVGGGVEVDAHSGAGGADDGCDGGVDGYGERGDVTEEYVGVVPTGGG